MKYTKEQVSEWKAKWGELFEISVEGKSCVLHKPTRRDLSYASVVKDPIKLSEVMLKQLWVAGDEEIKERDDLFMAVVSKMEAVLTVKEAEIKNSDGCRCARRGGRRPPERAVPGHPAALLPERGPVGTE